MAEDKNRPHDRAVGVNGAIVWRRGCVRIGSNRGCIRSGAEEKITSGAGSSFAFREIRRVAVDVELHVAGFVLDRCIRVCGTVVQQLCDGLGSGFGAFGLSRCESAECNQHGGVDGASVIQEGANNFLEVGDSGRVQGGQSRQMGLSAEW